MPPASQTSNSSPIDDAAAAVVLIEPDDVDGWEKARAQFLSDAENASPVVKECLTSVAEQLRRFKDLSAEERGAALKEVQSLLQTAQEKVWEEANRSIPKARPPAGKEAPAETPKSENDPQTPVAQAASVPGPLTSEPTPIPRPVPPEPAPRVGGGKFLTFFLDKEEYGFEILKVHEILRRLPVTVVPRMPAHVLGVINLRGKIIPVVDLRLKLGLPFQKDQDCIVIVRAHGIEVGVTVDRVSEVADIADGDIERVPSFGENAPSPDLMGLAKSNGHVRLLLNIETVLAPENALGAAASGGDR